MNLESLDRRLAARAIEDDLLRSNSRPVHISLVESTKSTLEAQLSFLASLRGVATPEQAAELEEEIRGKRAHLEKICAELADRNAAGRADQADLGGEIYHAPTITWKDLFDQVLEKKRIHGESKKALLEDWLKKHPGLSRTQVYDFLAGKTDGRISVSKRGEIQTAIRTSAEQLGLPTRTNSD
jgi:hypothetical protein